MSRRPSGATVDVLDNFDDMFARWIDAEARSDAGALDVLLDVDFRGDSPRGYVLTKQEWLDRYRQGDFLTRSFAWQDTHVRSHADTVVVRGIQTQTASDRGEPWAGRFRATLVALRRDGRWRVVNLQLSELDGHDPEEGTDGNGEGESEGDRDG
jgi:hypothetical protein